LLGGLRRRPAEPTACARGTPAVALDVSAATLGPGAAYATLAPLQQLTLLVRCAAPDALEAVTYRECEALRAYDAAAEAAYVGRRSPIVPLIIEVGIIVRARGLLHPRIFALRAYLFVRFHHANSW
jgi:hypothetical protein